jgi:putative transposase
MAERVTIWFDPEADFLCNPVKHGCSDSPYNWSCSSVHWYLEQEGRDFLRDAWVRYPVKGYGKEWDEFLAPENTSLKRELQTHSGETLWQSE